jgi:hypothetical protein
MAGPRIATTPGAFLSTAGVQPGRTATATPRVLAGALLLGLAACTYGAPEERATVSQVVRLGDSHRAVALIRRDTFRRPTGLNAFPDGGRWAFLQRQASQVLLDVESGRAVLLATQEAADSLWESFDAHISGVSADSVLYLSLTGCDRNGECYPELMNRELLRVSIRGDVRAADAVPADAALPGTMLARGRDEEYHVRFLTTHDTIAVRLEDDGPYRPMFRVAPDGTVVEIGG